MSLNVNISDPDEFNCIELHSAIENVAKVMNIPDFSYHVDYLNGNGYIANIFRVILTETGSDKTISVIVKTLINTARKDLFRELHLREVNAYTQIINKFRILQKDIEEKNRIVLPKYIYFSNEKGNELLIFKELLVNGFKVNDTLATHNKLEFSQVSLIFSELAKLHALSLVFAENDKDLYNKVVSSFSDLIFEQSFLDKSKLRDHFVNLFEESVEVINNPMAKDKLESIKTKLLPMFKNYVKPKKTNVLCHGDFWLNNILFKQMDNEEKLCFLDFQAMRYANPLTDIVYFLYICTDSQFRSDYTDKLLDVYYDSIKTFLSLFDIDASSIYTRDELGSNMEDYKAYGLLIALVEMRIIIPNIQTDQEPKKGHISDVDLKIYEKSDILFRSRINDVATEAMENGVLDRLLSDAKTIEIH
ncbi:unnamed protein product [Leptosia nina]|uniref:CHK kinase-like domain-containing protein n=1 Tax=Leptosia nina TaxID=320188 RepID=A0AAV1JE91_9NEOP